MSIINQFMHNPKAVHMEATSRVFCYLKYTPRKVIVLKNNELLWMEVYTNTDWTCSIINIKSTSAYCILLGGNLVTSRSKKQIVVTRSSVEAKFWAMDHGICELLWLKIILDDLKIKWCGPMKPYCDKKFAINIAYDLV